MKLLDLFFPPKCLSCRRFLENGDRNLCSSCESQWPHLTASRCTCCVLPFENSAALSHLCGDCLARPKSFQEVSAIGRYRGILHDLILRLKYRGDEWLSGFLGKKLSAVITNPYDLIVPIPLSRDRLRERGFNQALLLAREIGRHRGIAVDPFILQKTRSTPPQAGLKGKERWENLKGVFTVREPEKIQGKRILLIDDVYTTGATLEMASRELLHDEARTIDAAVLARA